MLLITAIIWGSAFVAQKAGTVLEPFTYNGIRMLIGGLVLIPVIFLFKKINKEDPDSVPKTELEKQAEKENADDRRSLLRCCSLHRILPSSSSVCSFFDTDAGKTGFITSLYIVIVPILGLFYTRR